MIKIGQLTNKWFILVNYFIRNMFLYIFFFYRLVKFKYFSKIKKKNSSRPKYRILSIILGK